MTRKPDPPPAAPVPLPDEAEFTWLQDSDSDEGGDLGQTLRVGVTDAGAGKFLWIKTERWAIDGDEIDGLAGMLKWALNQCRQD